MKNSGDRAYIIAKLSVIMWMMAGTVLGGTGVLAVLMLPPSGGHTVYVILLAAVAGAVIAMPLSYLLAKRIAPMTS